MTAPVRILDLRLVVDRDGLLRLAVDGRELVRAGSAVEALRFLADRLAARAPAEQLGALASAIGVATLPGAVDREVLAGRTITAAELELSRAGRFQGDASAEACTCPACGSYRPGYPFNAADPCLACVERDHKPGNVRALGERDTSPQNDCDDDLPGAA